MNEEEQIVIKTAKCIRAGVPVQTCDDDYIVLLNIIEKQQKEIEELKAINQIQKYRIEVIDEREFISKDKIREKIEDLESLSKNITMQPSIYNYEIDLLKELLEEN